MGSTSSTQIQDWGTSQRKAAVVVSPDITKNALVVANADWSNVWWATAAYAIRNIDDSSQTTYTYFGKQTAAGAWLVMRLTNATNAFEYAYGTSDYATAWTGRALLSYGDVE
jgi:hypothetical protein